MKLEDVEKQTIMAALRFNYWHRERTAQSLGISVRTIASKVKLYKEQGAQIPDSMTGSPNENKGI